MCLVPNRLKDTTTPTHMHQTGPGRAGLGTVTEAFTDQAADFGYGLDHSGPGFAEPASIFFLLFVVLTDRDPCLSIKNVFPLEFCELVCHVLRKLQK